MGLIDGAFDCYLLLGLRARGGRLWMSRNWERVEPVLEALVSAARAKAAWKHYQEYEATGREVRPSRQPWGSRAWLHGAKDRRHFFSADLYAPAKATCARQRQPPEVYLHLHSAASTLGYDQAVLLAVSRTLPQALREHARKVAAPALGKAANAQLRARTKRPLPFGRPYEEGSLPAVLGADQYPYFGMDPDHVAYDAERLPTLAELPGSWELF